MNRWVFGAVVAAASTAAWAQDGAKPAESPAAAADGLHPRIKMETSLGDIVLELDGEKAPITTLNFVEYAEDKFYDGTVFHRVMKTFMIQGGGHLPNLDEKKEGMRPPILSEWQNGLKNVRGSIAMARKGGDPHSASSQFFINVVDNARLDVGQADGAGYTAFGRVVEGMETVDKIRDTPVEVNAKYPGGPVVPKETVTIKAVRVVSGLDKTKLAAAAKETAEKAKMAKTKDDAAILNKAVEDKRKMEQAERERANAASTASDPALLAEAIKKAEEESKAKITKTESGLMYVDLKVGDGAQPKPTERVEVHYMGWLLDGKKFDSSVDRGSPATFGLNQVIKGWTEGVGSMKVGGKRRLIVPADLAYGAGGRPGIPGGATLVFDVELLAIK